LYLYDIPLEELNQALDVWFTDQLQRNQKERASVRSVDKLFLKFVYSDVVTVFDSADKTFELEHLFPVSRLAEIVRDEEEGWPISAISNLALFESKLNREKSKKTISEYLAEIPDADVRASKEAEISRYLLCDVSAVSISQDPNGRDSLSRDAYESFLRSRFEEMKRLALKTLGMSIQAG
jgi:hypothetical protein